MDVEGGVHRLPGVHVHCLHAPPLSREDVQVAEGLQQAAECCSAQRLGPGSGGVGCRRSVTCLCESNQMFAFPLNATTCMTQAEQPACRVS